MVFELRVLGTTDLRTSGGGDHASPRIQPKRLALLTYLAVARPRGFHRRGPLLALFWPEQDERHARWSLNQSLRSLRRDVGDALVSRGADEVALDGGSVWCDALAFEAACDGEDWPRALELYRGELLQGLSIGGCPELERWLDAGRARLQRSAARAARALIDCETAAGRFEHAAETARRLLELAPDDESSMRRYLALLGRTGDRGGAIRAFRQYAAWLKDELDVEPAPETLALIEILRATPPAAEPVAWKAPATAPAPVDPVEAGVVVDARTPEVRRGRVLGLLVLSVLLALGAFAGLSRWRGDGPVAALDEAAVLILPFRTATREPEVQWLAEGAVDLLAARLGGGGPRAIDPRVAVLEWRRLSERGPGAALTRDSALALARRLGAGQLLLGSVGGTSSRVTFTASLLDVRARRPDIDATVAGPLDSLPASLDGMLARLISSRAGEAPWRIEELAARPLPALRAYLEGQSVYRQGRYRDAAEAFQRALESDPAFALAALGLRRSIAWEPVRYPSGLRERADSIVWTHRDRLHEHDLLRFRALAGANHPAHTSAAEQLAFLEHAVGSLPFDPEMWYHLGDALFHRGALAGIADWHDRAADAFRRSHRLDSTALDPILHLFQLAADAGDTASVRQFGALVLEHHAASSIAWDVRWLMGTLLRDTTTLRRLRANRFADVDAIAVVRLHINGASLGIGLEDADLARRTLLERLAGDQRVALLEWGRTLALHRGRPAEAAATARAMLELVRDVPTRRLYLRRLVYEALYWDGDTAAARAAAAELALPYAPPGVTDRDGERRRVAEACALEQWRLARGDTRTARRTIAGLDTAASSADRSVAAGALTCAALLGAMLRSHERAIVPAAQRARLDSLLTNVLAEFANDPLLYAGNLVSARLHEHAGDRAAALAAVRRRGYGAGAGGDPLMLTTFLREEGRLAALGGDHPAAIRAYQHYAALRSDPEPALRQEVEAVRAALARLRSADAAAPADTTARSPAR